MIEYEGFFHIGIVVEDMQRGMDDIARRFAVTFPDARDANVRIRYGDEEQQVAVKFVYSREGPPYLELIEAVPGTVWEKVGIHHLGVFCDAMENEIEKLVSEGYTHEAASLGPDNSLQGAQYITNNSGVRLEFQRGEFREQFLKMLGLKD